MMQFTVPQFIDAEDKILGPITVRQFIILLIDGLILALAWKLADLTLFIVLLAFFGGFGLVLAFIKINGQSFHYFLLNFLQTLRKPTLRVWQKKFSDKELKELAKTEEITVSPPKPFKEALSFSKLSDVALSVDTGGRYIPEE